MPSYVVKCPYCHTIKSAIQNSQFSCRGCGARISVGNDGKIKNSTPGKRG